MKTKLFLAAMAAVAVIGCQKEPGTGTVEQADGQASFLKVNIKSTGTITKADPGTYEDGSDAENAVSTVTFWFFDAQGNKYPVTNDAGNFMSGAVAENLFATENPAVEYVEEQSGLILVIKQHPNKNYLPAKMVTVLNAPAAIKKSYASITDLADDVMNLRDDDNNKFIMSTSVYKNGDVVNYTAITADHLFEANLDQGVPGYNIPGTILEPGKAGVPESVTPVEIYVERLAAKVQTTFPSPASGETYVAVKALTDEGTIASENLTIYVITSVAGTAEATEPWAVYADVLGWDVTNIVDGTTLLKTISTDWTETLYDFTWNDADDFRSYWAATTLTPVHNHKFNSLTSNNAKYYHENTVEENATTDNTVGTLVDETVTGASTAANQASQLLVAVQLYKKVGDTYSPLNVARWYSKYYTIDAVKAAMVASVGELLYNKDDDGSLSSITASDVVFAQREWNYSGTTGKRCEVVVAPVEGKIYYDGTGTEVANAAEILGGISPAQIWGDETTPGLAYYYTPIQHFGTSYGLVRNHVYKIAVSNFGGLGTPVYEPEDVITPEHPTDYEAYNLSARINILSWHIVQSSVTLQ